jgi:hypothetical protein
MFIFDTFHTKSMKRTIRDHPNIQNERGQNILMVAAEHSNMEVFNYALEHSVSIHTLDNRNQNVLFYIIGNPRINKDVAWLQIVDDLVRAGIDLLIVNDYNQCLLHVMCASASCMDMFVLLSRPAHLSIQDCNGDTPIDYMFFFIDYGLMEWFLATYEYVLDMQPRILYINTRLCFMNRLYLEYTEKLKLLIKHGFIISCTCIEETMKSDVNAQRETSLLYCCSYFDRIKSPLKEYNILQVIREFILINE